MARVVSIVATVGPLAAIRSHMAVGGFVTPEKRFRAEGLVTSRKIAHKIAMVVVEMIARAFSSGGLEATLLGTHKHTLVVIVKHVFAQINMIFSLLATSGAFPHR